MIKRSSKEVNAGEWNTKAIVIKESNVVIN